MAMLYWGLVIVEIGRYRHFDVFVEAEMHLLVASDILRLTFEDFSIRVEYSLLILEGLRIRYIKVELSFRIGATFALRLKLNVLK